MANEDIEKYFSVAAQREELEESLTTASDITEPLFRQAVDNAATLMGKLSKQPDVRDHLVGLAAETFAMDQEFQTLEAAAKQGLVDPKEVESRRRLIEEDDHRRIARAYMVGAKVVDRTIRGQKAVDKASTDPVAEAPRRQTKVDITIMGDKALKIGANGALVKLAGRKDARSDVAPNRTALLTKLIEAQGQDYIKYDELWAMAFGDKPFDRNIMTQFRTWAAKHLTFRRQPMIEHNGKRLGSAYRVSPAFELKLTTSRTVATKTSPKKASPIALATGTPSFEIQPIQEVDEVYEANFPLSAYETYMIATIIDDHKEYLGRQGIELIDSEIVEKLGNSITYGDEKPPTNPDDVKRQRIDISEKLKGYFANEDLMVEDMDKLSEKDSRWAVFEYFCQTEGLNRGKLIELMVTSNARLFISTDGHGEVLEVHREILSPAGDLIYTSAPDGPRAPVSNETSESSGDLSVDSTQAQINTAVDSEQPSDLQAIEPEVLIEDVHIDLTPTAAAEAVEKHPEFTKALSGLVAQIMDVITRYNLIGKNSNQIGSAFKNEGLNGFKAFMVNSVIKSASENGLIRPANSGGWSARDILMFRAYHDPDSKFRGAIGVRSSVSKPDRRLVERIIDQGIENYRREHPQK